MDILRGNILQIDLVYPGAVFHVKGHARRRCDVINGQGRGFFQFSIIAGGPVILCRGALYLRRAFTSLIFWMTSNSRARPGMP